jgi:hypothetical protein
MSSTSFTPHDALLALDGSCYHILEDILQVFREQKFELLDKNKCKLKASASGYTSIKYIYSGALFPRYLCMEPLFKQKNLEKESLTA